MLFRLVPLIVIIVFQINAIKAVSQDNSNLSHYFMNPYSINPSFAGTDGRPSLFLTYRLQWADIEGAPKITNASFHAPLGNKMGFGLNATNAERGPLNTTSAYLSNSIGIPLSEKFIIRFGASFGAATNTVDLDALANADPLILNSIDPLADNNLFLIGNVGLSLQAKYFNFGASIPNIFADDYVTTEAFSQGEVSAMENILVFVSNRFYFNKKKKHMFEPYVLYRHSDVLPPLLEATGIITLNHTVWFGGSYKQDFGITAVGGFKFNKTFGLGYAYSLSNSGENEINSPTHEIQLNLLLGGRKENRVVYSFVDSELPKPKSKRQLALEERRKQLEEQKRLLEEQRKAEEEQKQQEEEERIARENEERIAREQQEKVESEREEQSTTEAERLEQERKAQEATRIEQERLAKEEADRKAQEEARLEQQLKDQENSDNTQVVEKEPEVKSNQNLVEKYSTENRVVVKRGNHLLELGKGEYVIVGVFGSYEQAEKYSDDLFFKGYQSKFGYITQEKYWYVYVYQGSDGEDARRKRDELRQKNIFSKAWVLTVE